MAEAIVIVTRLKEDRLEVLTTKPVGPSVTLPTAALAAGEHPAEGALRALDATVGSDACQAFRKLTTGEGQRHYFQASPEVCDETLPQGCAWTPLSEARAAAEGGVARVLEKLG